MTKKDLYNQKLVEEANHAHLHSHTRRHFLKESAMGLGALALGSLVGMSFTIIRYFQALYLTLHIH
jgi:hypothetical protein